MSIVKGPDRDREAVIRRMIGEHQTALLRLCYLYLHDVQLAEDAVQETFIKVWLFTQVCRRGRIWRSRPFASCLGRRRV